MSDFEINNDITPLGQNIFDNYKNTIIDLIRRENKNQFSKIEDFGYSLINMELAKDGMLLKHVIHPTEGMMITAVSQNGLALQFIPYDKQTINIVDAALKENPLCYKYAPSITNRISVLERLASMTLDEVFEYGDYECGTPDEELEHPILYMKNIISDETKLILLYRTFLINNDYNIKYISKSISGKSFEKDMYKFALTSYTFGRDLLKDIPMDIQKEIIDDCLKIQPLNMLSFDPSFWTNERVEAYIKASCEIGDIRLSRYIYDCDDKACSFTNNEILKLILNNDSTGYSCIIINPYISHPDFDTFKELLDTRWKYKLLSRHELYNINTKTLANYIFNTWDVNDIFEHLEAYDVNKFINNLSGLKRLKFKHKYSKYKKHSKERSDENE